jgi:hypothetical protein
MQNINKKFTNFLTFLKEIDFPEEYINEISQVNSIIFITKLKTELDKYNCCSEMDKIISLEKNFSEKYNIELYEYSTDDKHKFRRYLLYFYKISQTLL